jgi:2-polyprenyl-3-methyl-5-hydroxy-6-metoxy-1,4-benzoquinol methylase
MIRTLLTAAVGLLAQPRTRLAMNGKVYSPKFFEHIRDASGSAVATVPKILEVYPARSVIDVGCGIGAWLKAFADLGVIRIAGVDGDYVDRQQSMIPAACFVGCDLDVPFAFTALHRALGGAERFDLALFLEVGEHLPVARAASLVSDLCALADVVLFGAAIPFQGWQRAYVNEQWQSYWAAKFAANVRRSTVLTTPLRGDDHWDSPSP